MAVKSKLFCRISNIATLEYRLNYVRTVSFEPIFDITVGVYAFDDAPNNIVGPGAITVLGMGIEDIVQGVVMGFGIVNGR